MPTEPPTYDQATACHPNQQQAAIGPQTLILEGFKIYTAEDHTVTLYELSSSPREAIANSYNIYKTRYRLAAADGEGDITSRQDHIYQFQEKSTFSLRRARPKVVITGHCSKQRTYKEVILSGRSSGWTSCRSEGHFSAATPTIRLFQNSKHITWKNASGEIVGYEPFIKKGSEEPSRLIVEAILDAKDLDLLVACWMARLWKESKAWAYKQLPSADCKLKNFTSISHRQRNTAKLGGFVGTSGTVFA
ncbi:hypothetical protein IF1G_06334 [Cordyceps javanica]|uniref:Uncharacterized protein n=1 Tax=Cordyceps javanica TaxID=43265 RepID=A0A545V0X3_9HYPO|nr:hypothetical protein IF1G_06334 [Cordyceps javanica]